MYKSLYFEKRFLMTPSSRGLGHRPFTAVTRVRLPLGSPRFKERFNRLSFFYFLKLRYFGSRTLWVLQFRHRFIFGRFCVLDLPCLIAFLQKKSKSLLFFCRSLWGRQDLKRGLIASLFLFVQFLKTI